MEIRYLKQEEKEQSRVLYEEVFVEDEKAFVDAYYSVKACDNRILTAWEEGKPVSMLHRNPYTFRLRGKPIRADYLVAVATRFACRRRMASICRFICKEVVHGPAPDTSSLSAGVLMDI